MKPKVLLLGCTGEVGSRLTLLMLESGYEVFGIRGSKECLISNPLHSCLRVDLLAGDVEIEIATIKPEILIHTAWITTPTLFWNTPENYLWLEASKRLVEDFETNGGKYLVVTGTCAEYSWRTREALDENSLELPASLYGKSKFELLKWLRTRPLPFLWTRTFFQFGAKESAGRLVPTLIDSLLKGQEFLIQNGQDIRDFVYIEDVVQVLHELISRRRIGVFNLGSGKGIQIRDISSLLASLLGREELLKFSAQINPISIVISDPAKLNAVAGPYVWRNLPDALMESIESRRAL